MADPIDEDERTTASDTLRRLVRFLASALDVRYAFVVTPVPGEGAGKGGLALWVARDYGLRADLVVVELKERPPEASLDVVTALRLALPLEVEHLGRGHDRIVSVEVLGSGGRPIGRLGILDAQGRRGLFDAERLAPLARRAAAELERWAAHLSSP